MKISSLFLFLFAFYLPVFLIGQSKNLHFKNIDSTNKDANNKYDIIRTYSNSSEKDSLLNDFTKKLINEGYINFSIEKENNSNTNTTIYYYQTRHKIEKIEISLEFIEDNFLLKEITYLLPSDLIINYETVEENLQTLSNQLSNKGYPFLNLKLTEIKQKNENTLKAQLIIEKNGNKRKIDQIKIRGYKKFPKSYVNHFLKIKNGKNLNLTQVRKKLNRLKSLSFSRQIKEPEILFTKDSSILYMYLEKTKSNNFDGFLGFTTNENTNKIEFNGYLDVELINNLNFGEKLILNYKKDESNQTIFNIDTELPYILNSPVGLNIGLNITKIDSTFSNNSQKINLFYPINDKHIISAGLLTTISSNLSNTTENNLLNYQSNFTNLNYTFTLNQEDLFFNTKTRFSLNLGFGNRKTSLTTNKQQIITFNGNHIFRLNQSNNIYINLDTQLLLSDNFLENELFRFGGINSIRGFSENTLTANSLLVINTEYRYILSNNLFVNSITDFANFQNNNLNLNENLYSFGFGFGLKTKSGLLRFIYANGKNENTPFKLNNSKIHLKLSTTF
ncbi:hypothetical protein C7H62_1670 [Mesoflavibacter sp. HG96]|uniref:POTRA domain-containing protein n=1 Tax=Mesoflavibacter profundi TaxID=2708110 RepID=A0ABT4S416_9FLAO|nr:MULTISPECIES: hypothetical protein [Mesoflavibacter]MDA0178540.1 hypothetical protein [Mesoflavibacter profundi]QIJ89479.1 hypothetical protein C7H62_1670 [Mesoflavibacter sp. HG96]QIJ92207.1 hypothetical protein C7H56_1670 [Mesoflavibacter sp. HG37]